jgi:hypothetical protein
MSVVRQMQFSHYDIAETAPWFRRAAAARRAMRATMTV